VVWAAMEVDAWVEVVALSPSALVTGSAARRAVDITTSPRTLAVSDAVRAVLVQLLWLTLDTRLPWSNRPTTAWDRAQSLALQGRALSPLLLVEPSERTQLVPLIAVLPRSLSNLLATALPLLVLRTTSTRTKVKATPLPSSLPALETCP
jgi:hypothetical protein